jgi:hypothetical protein
MITNPIMGVIIFAMFWHNVEITQYKLEKKNSFQLNSLCYGLPHYVKCLKKYAPKLP